LSSTLPRKFKIAFEGCATDHIAVAINDLGFAARIAADGTRGFRVTAGGGTAIMCKSAGVLHEFLPVAEMFRSAEAVLRVFKRLGDYEHKQRNRIKFLIKALGWDGFVREYHQELAACTSEGVPLLEIDPPAVEPPPDWKRDEPPSARLIASRVGAATPVGPGITPTLVPIYQPGDEAYLRWRTTNVKPQRQFGYVIATATVPLGDLTSEQMRVLGELARAYSDGTVRVTPDQDLVFRWVRIGDVRELYGRLSAAGLGLADAATIADVASCPGAESCRLAVTQSRGLGRVLEDFLRSRPDLIAAADGTRIKISGCPNGCGQHHIATFGFQGSVRRIGGKAVPQYFVMVGGGATSDGASFARLAAKVPARRIPDVVERLISLYARERAEGESAPDFFARIDVARVTKAVEDLQQLTEADALPGDYVDLGDTAEFAPEVMDGECSA
jgi:sulfite reductase (NADPH) hemoprotein beta-component